MYTRLSRLWFKHVGGRCLKIFLNYLNFVFYLVDLLKEKYNRSRIGVVFADGFLETKAKLKQTTTMVIIDNVEHNKNVYKLQIWNLVGQEN